MEMFSGLYLVIAGVLLGLTVVAIADERENWFRDWAQLSILSVLWLPFLFLLLGVILWTVIREKLRKS